MKLKHIPKFIKIVKAIAECSEDKRLKVGALIIKEGRIISTGYNGQLPGLLHDPEVKDGHDDSTVHAEQNAIMNCAKQGISTKDCRMLVTHFPCKRCVKLAIMAGILIIYYLEDYKNDESSTRIMNIRKLMDNGKEK